MRKTGSLMLAALFLSVAPFSAFADISDYVGDGPAGSKCPATLVIRPDLSDKNVFAQVDPPDLHTASEMIGATVAGKFNGARVIPTDEINDYKMCNVPVLLTKLKSYTTKPARWGQHTGKAVVQILKFTSPSADAPEKGVDVSGTGEKFWGDSEPFLNAIRAVCDKIQKTKL